MVKKDDFTQYVNVALQNSELASMRPVVEKELLHYEIFNALDEEGLLKNLVFQGGTSLRLCRGSDRFSEDLDFAGGREFSSAGMNKVKDCIIQRIGGRFGLRVSVKEPKPVKERTLVNVDKWTISIETSPGYPDVPAQKIKLEIANIPAYTKEPVPLRMNYSVLEGMKRVIVITETIDEILADKIVALPTSIARVEGDVLIPTPTKVRYRDIWDLAWLIEQGAKLESGMVMDKIRDYGICFPNFRQLLDFTIQTIPSITASRGFKDQMRRFIKKSACDNSFEKPGYDAYLANTITRLLVVFSNEFALQQSSPSVVDVPSR